MKFFTASLSLNHENTTEIYIRKCKKFIEKETINPDNNSKIKSNATNTNNISEANKTQKSPLTEEDLECLKIIKEKDYYKILNITKTADENDVKKSYKKVLDIILKKIK